MKKKITFFQLIALSIAFYGSIRNIPVVASAGWFAIFYMVGAAVFFAIPISLIAAELATGWPQEGGPQVWVKAALGERWSFVTSWLLWVQMFFGMVMVATACVAMFPYVIGDPTLSNNPIFIVIAVIVTYWILTIFNLKSNNIGKFINTWGSIVGIYIPASLLMILGIFYFIQHGNVNLGPLTLKTLIPNMGSLGTMSFFTGIIFIFAGLEIASVHANDIENPKKNYPKAVFLTIALMVIFNLVCGLTEANAIPQNKIELAVITQPFAIYFKEIGLPWLTNIIALMIAFGVIAQLNAWILGPSKAMIKIAEDGLLPPVFQKRNKFNVPITFVILQAIVISLVTLLYVIVPAINTGFIIILMLTTVLYCIVYIFIIIAEIVLRYTKPDVYRAAPVPGGKVGMWIFSILALIGVAFTIIVSVIPNSFIPQNLHGLSIGIQVIGTLILFVFPLIIYKFKKPSWVKVKSEDSNL